METVDRIYWTRAATAIVGAVTAAFVFSLTGDGQTGVIVGVFFYLISFYFVKYVLKIEGDPEGKVTPNTLLTQGIGTYIILFLFFWILLTNLLFI